MALGQGTAVPGRGAGRIEMIASVQWEAVSVTQAGPWSRLKETHEATRVGTNAHILN